VHALIIEDELLLAFSVEEAVRDIGYSTVEIATSVAGAVQAAGKQCPDLIVADHRIIDGTGTDAVLAICCERAIPVVFVTSSGPEVQERLPNAVIVQKPFKIPHLKAAVGAAVENPFRHSSDEDTPTLRIMD
jgi:DNA-binding response OmpR family regulator